MLYCFEHMTWIWHILNNRCVTALIIHDPRYLQCHPLLSDKRVTQHEASNLYYNSPYLCRCSQTAILARSSREMSLTFRIVWQYILSRVRVSIRPSNFFTRKTSKSIANTASHKRLIPISLKHRTSIVHRSRSIDRQQQRS